MGIRGKHVVFEDPPAQVVQSRFVQRCLDTKGLFQGFGVRGELRP